MNFKNDSLMKNLFKVLFVAAATTMLFACTKELPVQDEIPSTGNEQVVHFSTTPITKTVFGTASGTTLPTLWTDAYCVGISMNYATAKKSTTPVVGTGGTTASFEASIDAGEATSFVFHAVSPYEAYVSSNSSYKSVQFTVPTAQTPSATSPDEKAQILFGQYDAGSTFPTSVTMDFEHLTAYGKISFSNLSLATGETVASVSLTAAENWAGRYYYYVEDNGTNSAGDYQESSSSKTITITTDQTSDIWFGCAPVDLGGKTIDVVVTTDKGTTYSKTITIPAGKKFTAGVVNAFTISMSGITAGGAVVYTLVKDVADLTLGSEVIIVADAFDYAISTTQNTNNRGQASVTKSTSTGGDDIVASPGVDVQVLTIANGNKAGTYAFSTGTGYLNAVSGSNHLKTQGTLDNTGSWFVSITSAGVATVKSVGTTDVRQLRYNDNNSIFSCYTSGQKDIRIYKKNGTGSGTITAKEAESLVISGATISYSVDDTYSFDGIVKLVYSDTSEETLSASDYTMDDSDVDMTKAGKYTIDFTYNADSSITGSYEITVTGGSTGGSVTVTSSDLGSASTTATSMDSEISYANSASNSYSNPMRIYANNTFTITSKTQDITKVVYTCNSASYATTLSTATFTVDSGASTTVSVSGTEVTVTITGSTKSVAAKPSAQIRLDALAVTYGSDSGSGSGTDETQTVDSSDLGSASTTATDMDSEISYVNSASNSYSNPMRIYANNTFTISSKTKAITEVVYTCNTEAYATTLSTATFTVASGASTSVAVSGKEVTVTITGTTTSVAAKPSAQIRLDALSVTYKK